MRTIIAAVLVLLIAGNAAAQECTPCAALANGPSNGGLSLGAGILAPAVVPQEKAPPESVLVDVEPVVKKRVMPEYPELAKKAGIQGKVFVRFWVDAEGRVRDAKVVKSEHEILNQAAVEAAQKWTFEPAMKGKKAVPVWLNVPFMFKLADKTNEANVGGLQEGMKGMVGCIATLLSGKDVEGCKGMVAAESSAIIGGKYMTLLEAIDRWGTPDGLPNEKGWQIDYIRTVADKSGEMTTIIVRNVEKKGGASRYHTVVCERGKDGWKLKHWHTM